MLNDRSSALSLLQSRRSGRPRDLVEPGPDEAQLREIVRIAARTPDHGKLAPWRFVHVPRAGRGALAELLHRAYRLNNPHPTRLEIETVDRLAHQAPELVVALSSPMAGTKIPLWEQELSCGAACMNLLSAAHAMGFAAGWITGWPAYSEEVRGAFAREGERIAGFFYIGTPAHPLEERPRPALDYVFSEWAAEAAT
ncbi:MAG TPA: nitroreductase [Allosphingosinicella sp.]|nr:nitroreductase [Allosphingosinicella sp.]